MKAVTLFKARTAGKSEALLDEFHLPPLSLTQEVRRRLHIAILALRGTIGCVVGDASGEVIVRGPTGQKPMWGFAADWDGKHVVTRDPIGPLVAVIPATGWSAEDACEQFIAAEVDSAPEALRRLGDYLSNALDEDSFKAADRMVLGAMLETSAAIRQVAANRELGNQP